MKSTISNGGISKKSLAIIKKGFKNRKISQQPQNPSDQNQLLLEDSPYASDWYTIPAYKGNEFLYRWNVYCNYVLAQSQVKIINAIVRNHREMKVTIMWIISCVFLHNLLVELKDQWNELCEKYEPDSAPVVVKNIEKSNNGIFGISNPITLSYFEESP
ncbi:hypothetical protein VP01_100g8 [Puccinia sorghi]|uniref:DDE Tnp4 domain-containing protein n=1 Tax=Puccinia sorghi TaxID=27349 RepID=A0A0L6VVF0_9BASI|nr:hypothetical protein VP01_100g8 [Puccinia sorghi]